jgi:predicted nucleic acid-binding protein
LAEAVTAVFADTAYWIAMFRRDDPWRSVAEEASARLGGARIVTVDEVLVEFLAAVSAAGPVSRLRGVRFVRSLLSDPNIDVRPKSRDSLFQGLGLYEARADQRYSLTDCVAMTAMRAAGITQVLTTDRHFEQEGFALLMKR